MIWCEGIIWSHFKETIIFNFLILFFEFCNTFRKSMMRGEIEYELNKIRYFPLYAHLYFKRTISSILVFLTNKQINQPFFFLPFKFRLKKQIIFYMQKEMLAKIEYEYNNIYIYILQLKNISFFNQYIVSIAFYLYLFHPHSIYVLKTN